MNFEEHYGELTEDILLDGLIPYANSLPINKCFLGKKFQKVVKKSELPIDNFMNVCFEKEQSIKDGSTITWTLQDLELNVFVIESKKLFVKGKQVWVYAVGIIEGNNEEK